MSLLKTKKIHAIWEFFAQDEGNPKYAICSVCRQKVSRGGIGRSSTNTSMINHLKAKHVGDYQKFLEKSQAENSKLFFSFVYAFYSVQ